MSMKKTDNANITKANATRDSVFTTCKYIEHLPNKPITLCIREKDKYDYAHIPAAAMEFSRRQEPKPSTFRKFFRLKM